MRESIRMEQYAQRAVDRRRKQQDSGRKVGDFLMIQYLAQGDLLRNALKSMSPMERQIYIAKHTELIESSDGVEGINVVWCPNTQILTHRLLCPELRKEFGGQHYLSSWVRQVGPKQRDDLRAVLRQRLEQRVMKRQFEKDQLALDFAEVC